MVRINKQLRVSLLRMANGHVLATACLNELGRPLDSSESKVQQKRTIRQQLANLQLVPYFWGRDKRKNVYAYAVASAVAPTPVLRDA